MVVMVVFFVVFFAFHVITRGNAQCLPLYSKTNIGPVGNLPVFSHFDFASNGEVVVAASASVVVGIEGFP